MRSWKPTPRRWRAEQESSCAGSARRVRRSAVNSSGCDRRDQYAGTVSSSAEQWPVHTAPAQPGAVVVVHGPDEQVVLVDEQGRPCGVADKATVHGRSTPRHLAFSCYAFDAAGRLLVTQRALSKSTFPGVWTNTCCGHPAPGEALPAAAARRLEFELGLTVSDMRMVLPDFSYRASDGRIEENEFCPVLVCRIDGEPSPRPDEVETA